MHLRQPKKAKREYENSKKQKTPDTYIIYQNELDQDSSIVLAGHLQKTKTVKKLKKETPDTSVI